MTTLAFVLWMIGYPTMCSLCRSFSVKVGRDQGSENAQAIGAFIELAIWVSIAVLLWDNR